MAAGDLVSGPCDTATWLEFGSLGFCSREDGTDNLFIPWSFDISETQYGKEGSVISLIQRGYSVSRDEVSFHLHPRSV